MSPVSTKPASNDYAELRRIVRSEGLLEPQTAYYVLKVTGTVALLLFAMAVPFFTSNPVIIMADALLLAFASTQTGLLSHDVIHRQAFRGRRLNAVLRLFLGNFLLGLSHSWWANKHNAHHANPNHVEKDPDLDIPFIIFDEDEIQYRPRWQHPLIAVQTVVLPVLFFLGALSMRAMSIRHLVREPAPGRLVQLALIAANIAIYALILFAIGSVLLAAAFAVVHFAVFGFYNSSVFASNHKGMPLVREDERLDFLREQVLTSRDVDGNPFNDFVYGGLNYQIEHHLFPTMPRNNLSRAQAIVREFCAERGIAHESTSIFAAYRQTWSHLHEASASLRRRSAPTA